MELSGKVIKVLPMQSGTGKNGEWRRQEFVIEIPGTYPKKVAISGWNERTMEIQSLALGDEIKAQVDVESREYNDKWYTDVKAWKIEKMTAGSVITSQQAQNPATPNTGGNPFGDASNQGGESPFDNNSSEEQEDDLPF